MSQLRNPSQVVAIQLGCSYKISHSLEGCSSDPRICHPAHRARMIANMKKRENNKKKEKAFFFSEIASFFFQSTRAPQNGSASVKRFISERCSPHVIFRIKLGPSRIGLI